MDWSESNNIALALNKDMYMWNAGTGDITLLFSLDEEENGARDHYISSCLWLPEDENVLAVGKSDNCVELWDVSAQRCIRRMKSQEARVGSLACNQHIITSGSRSGSIHNHDVRIKDHHVGTFTTHTHEVCGLKYSMEKKYLASGANDNLVCIWDPRMLSCDQPMHVLREHSAAVKALAWSPWQSNILATGGGTADAHIKIWNIYNGSVVKSLNAKSQISGLLWSKHYKELISCHGFQQNQLVIWKYPEMSKVTELNGHKSNFSSLLGFKYD
jgi:cell division cycle protein 20 (cofactor of APC complex)